MRHVWGTSDELQDWGDRGISEICLCGAHVPAVAIPESIAAEGKTSSCPAFALSMYHPSWSHFSPFAAGGEAPERTLLTWGENQSGQLGYETQSEEELGATPAVVPFKTSSPVEVRIPPAAPAPLDTEYPHLDMINKNHWKIVANLRIRQSKFLLFHLQWNP